MTQFDWLYSMLIAVLLIADHFVFTRMFRRRCAVDPVKARRQLWSWWFLPMLWLLTALGVLLWAFEGRSWQAIGLSIPTGWRAWGGAAVILIALVLQVRGAFKVAGNAAEKEKVRDKLRKLGTAGAMLPRTRSEFRLWVWASLTAGIGEEFLCRGYLIWVFNHWFGWWVAAALSLVIFSLGHSYQGTKGALLAGLGGAGMTLIVAIFSSLLPAMAVHALIDIGVGYMAWLALREEARALGVERPVPDAPL